MILEVKKNPQTEAQKKEMIESLKAVSRENMLISVRTANCFRLRNLKTISDIVSLPKKKWNRPQGWGKSPYDRMNELFQKHFSLSLEMSDTDFEKWAETHIFIDSSKVAEIPDNLEIEKIYQLQNIDEFIFSSKTVGKLQETSVSVIKCNFKFCVYKGTRAEFQRLNKLISSYTILFDENFSVKESENSRKEVLKLEKILEIEESSVISPLKCFFGNNGIEKFEITKIINEYLVFEIKLTINSEHCEFTVDFEGKTEELAKALYERKISTVNPIKELNEIFSKWL